MIGVLRQRLTVERLRSLEPPRLLVGEARPHGLREASGPPRTPFVLGGCRRRCGTHLAFLPVGDNLLQPRVALRQDSQKWRQMLLVMPPAPDRAAIDRLSHLPTGGREDRPFGAMELETGRLPVEAEEFDQASALAFGIGDQRLVIDGQHREWQYATPMVGQSLDLEKLFSAIGEVIREQMPLGKPLKIEGQAGISCLTPTKNNASRWEQDGDHPKKENIVEHL